MNDTFHLISLAITLQSLESLLIKPWPWAELQSEMPTVLRPFLKHEQLLHLIRLLAVVAAAATVHPLAIDIVLLMTWLVNVRWRGTFNGGSDAMTFQILAIWLLCEIFPGHDFAFSGYLSFLLVLSYFVAGVAKVRNPAWRDGSMMATVALQYASGTPHRILSSGKIGAWAVMIFELAFPLALFVPLPFLIAASIFHFAATYTLGLNRFFFVWIALFPAFLHFHQLLGQ